MAGRGRGVVLPAWMTAAGQGATEAGTGLPASAPAPAPHIPAPLPPQVRAPPPPPPGAFVPNMRPPPQFADSYGHNHARPPPPQIHANPAYVPPVVALPPPQAMPNPAYVAPMLAPRPTIAHPVTEPKLTWISRHGPKKSNFDVGPNGEVALPGVVFGQTAAHAQPAQSSSAPVVGGGTSGGDLSATKHARRLYVGGIPRGVPETDISAFFTDIVHKTAAREYTSGGPVVLNVWLNTEKAFAFVEFNSIELASACMALDGITFSNPRGSAAVRVRRPNDYRPDLVPPSQTDFIPLNLGSTGVVSTTVLDGPNKIFFGGVPFHLTLEQIKELFVAFGPLKAFHLVKEPGQVTSKGYGFLEFVDPSLTSVVCMAMNGFQLGDKTLTVRPHSSSAAAGGGGQQASVPMSMPAPGAGQLPGGMGGGAIPNHAPTTVLRLLNMLTKEELFDDNEYADITDDVSGECSQYGRVAKIIIPRSKDGFPASCDGSVFIQYADVNGAKAAAGALSGRKFAERTLAVEFYDESKFMNNVLDHR